MQGVSLGPYRPSRLLGSGGMGRVYAATVADKIAGIETGATVAVKVLHPHLLEAEERLETRWLLWRATGDRVHLGA